MKRIAIAGTRGIPNRYGGFEQFAGQLSVALALEGYETTVYNPHHHPFREKLYHKVHIVRRWDPRGIGPASQFIYDFLCALHARREHFDVVIQLGYTTSSVWGWLLPGSMKTIWNMDGIEWGRAKYNGITRAFLKLAEGLAARRADVLVADAMPIKAYLDKKYHTNSALIAYPATVLHHPDPSVPGNFNLACKRYHLMVTRFQTDNQPEMIIRGVLESNSPYPLVIVGDHRNRHGSRLRQRYGGDRVVFLGTIFDQGRLDNLRHFASLYFHGHSAGGTNPSLLEAMGASCLICAHRNVYNESVLEGNAFYFSGISDISAILNQQDTTAGNPEWIANNLEKIRLHYNPGTIAAHYRNLID